REAGDRPTMAELRDGLLLELKRVAPDDAVSLMTAAPPPAPDALADTVSFEEASARAERFTGAEGRPRRSRRKYLLAAGALLLAVSGGVVWRAWPAKLPPLPPGERRSLALLPTAGGDSALPQLLAQELRAGE